MKNIELQKMLSQLPDNMEVEISPSEAITWNVGVENIKVTEEKTILLEPGMWSQGMSFNEELNMFYYDYEKDNGETIFIPKYDGEKPLYENVNNYILKLGGIKRVKSRVKTAFEIMEEKIKAEIKVTANEKIDKIHLLNWDTPHISEYERPYQVEMVCEACKVNKIIEKLHRKFIIGETSIIYHNDKSQQYNEQTKCSVFIRFEFTEKKVIK